MTVPEWVAVLVVAVVALAVGGLFGALFGIGVVARTMEANHAQIRNRDATGDQFPFEHRDTESTTERLPEEYETGELRIGFQPSRHIGKVVG